MPRSSSARLLPRLRGLFTALALGAALSAPAVPARAYDLDGQGVPRFSSLYIDLTKITRISRYRSGVGHDYSDQTQFGQSGWRDARNIPENCRSMKHYFIAPDSGVKIFAPVSGSVTSIQEGMLGSTVEFRADAQPDFYFGIFHVKLDPALTIGQHVDEGQQLGTHIGLDTWSDISVWVQTPRGKHLISYVETLTDDAFAALAARGAGSREAFVRTKEERDAEPCAYLAPVSDFVALSGPTPATQTVRVTTILPDTLNVGDAPRAIAATATSGLPVEVVSTTPKVCVVAGNVMTPRRPGVCKLLATQPGNAATYEAAAVALRTTIIPAGAALAPPRLAGVYPPGGAGAQSYLRFFNAGTRSGTVTASLIDAATGQVMNTWKSAAIAPGASPQFGIDELERGLPAGFTRPAFYGVRIEPETTLDGFLQHVVLDDAAGSMTNASTCDQGVTTQPHRIMNVHTSRLADRFASTLVLHNIGLTQATISLTLRDVNDGSVFGRFTSGAGLSLLTTLPVAFPNNQVVVNAATMESAIWLAASPTVRSNVAPVSAFQFNMADENAAAVPDSQTFIYYYQHLVTSAASGLAADMTAVCALSGRSRATANALLRVGGVFSTLQTAAQSAFRIYNAGEADGTVAVKMYGTKDDQPLGTWTTPVIPAGAMREFPIATIENELTFHRKDSYIPRTLAKENFYGLSFQTDIDGVFQHVLKRPSDGAVSNVTSCSDAVTGQGRSLMAVHPGGQASSSVVVVANTGAAPAAARLNFHNAADGSLVGSYDTPAIPAGATARLEVSAMEAAGNFSLGPSFGGSVGGALPGSPYSGDGAYGDYGWYGGADDFYGRGMSVPASAPPVLRERTAAAAAPGQYYIVKLEGPFTGFLQHIVRDGASGVTSDMTTACMM